MQNVDQVQLVPLTAETVGLVENWLGLKGNGRMESYLTSPVNDISVLKEIGELLFKEVISQQGYETAKKAVKKYIDDNKDKAGVFEDCYWDLVYDLYSQIDRATANQNAIRLGLNYAIYEGGLTTHSRNFCKEHEGKVYSRDEIAAFNSEESNIPDYNPIQDMGGVGCRHY